MKEADGIGCLSSRRARRQAGLAAVLVVLAGLGQPLFARMVAEYYPPAATALPPIVLVAAICLICPFRPMPLLAVGGVCAVEGVWILLGPAAVRPLLIERLFGGQLGVLWIPAAAAAAGWGMVQLRRRCRAFPPGFRTNLRVLTRRPLLFARKYRLPLAVLVLGSALDAATTIDFMLHYGPGEELHPAARVVADVFGVPVGVILGAVVRLAFVLVVAAVWRKWCAWMMVICGILYALAAASNHLGWMRWFWLWWW